MTRVNDLFATSNATPPPGLHAGIGGWVYAPWRGGMFYPAGLVQRRELEYASRHVACIEINGTYYGTQKPATYASWRDQTPDGFVFSAKAPKRIVTARKLASTGGQIEDFIEVAGRHRANQWCVACKVFNGPERLLGVGAAEVLGVHAPGGGDERQLRGALRILAVVGGAGLRDVEKLLRGLGLHVVLGRGESEQRVGGLADVRADAAGLGGDVVAGLAGGVGVARGVGG